MVWSRSGLSHHQDWQHWIALNRQLMEQWRQLLASFPDSASRNFPGFPFTAPSSSPEHETGAGTAELLARLGNEILAVFETGLGCAALSPNWKRITGHAEEASLHGTFCSHVGTLHQKAFLSVLQQATREDGALPPPLQLQLIHADGTLHWYRLRVAEIEMLPGNQRRIACVLRNIGDVLDMQRQVREAKRESQLALQSRSEFLNAMSHELRTPLNAILGFTQIMESGIYGPIDNPQYRDYLTHIRQSGYDLLYQIDEVMQLASLDAEQQSLQRETCQLKELLRQVIDLHADQAEKVEVKLHSHVGPGLSQVNVDRTKLQHCISHILSNAIRFCRTGGDVLLEAEIRENQELCIAVIDNGLGMSARTLQRVVGVLQEGESDPAEPKGTASGNGMGLLLARQYAARHHGYITLESKAGAGTRVNIHLPAECIARARQPAQEYIPTEI